MKSSNAQHPNSEKDKESNQSKLLILDSQIMSHNWKNSHKQKKLLEHPTTSPLKF